MIKVAIDTSTKLAGVCVQPPDGAPLERTWHSRQNHCRELVPSMMELLKECDAEPRDIGLVAVALGPGRFSAVRVGIATAIGLCLPRNLQPVGVPSYAVEAEPHRHALPLHVLLPAARREIAWFELSASLERPAASGLADADRLVETLPPRARICGEGVNMLNGEHGKLELAGDRDAPRSPAALLRIVARRAAGERFPLAPIYAKQPSIATPQRG